MPIEEREIEILKDGFPRLETEFGLNTFEDTIDENLESVIMPFPREEMEIEIDSDYLVQYLEELDSFKIHDFNKVTTDTITQRVITISEFSPTIYYGFLDASKKNGIGLHIVTEPILIGIAATKTNEYSKYHPPCSSHIAVEVQYPNKESRLPHDEEEKLIKSYFFELAHIHKIGLSFSTFEHPAEFDEGFFQESLKDLPDTTEDYNAGMELFINANQAISDDLKFMTYYKIFEYFAPLYSKIDAFEALRKKLDSSNAINLNADFIASIFDLTKNYEKSIRDKELVKSLIDNTFDLVDIYQSLPLAIRKGAQSEILEYKTKKDIKDRVINYVGNVLYSTRNAIVHAKSNFESTGMECQEKDLKELNDFMHKACYSTIKWYNRLPKHLKIT
ncbi:hypothetical protein [Maribacter sp.]|uniref:hypothetical protein n=1 Tax=Maribacter sp. TaxID=1897614 RepID=UPI0025BFE4CD|nr:hypothetical protein [Maribacter sp.]